MAKKSCSGKLICVFSGESLCRIYSVPLSRHISYTELNNLYNDNISYIQTDFASITLLSN